MAKTAKGLLVPVGAEPTEIELALDDEGSCYEALCRLVGGEDLDMLGGVLAPGVDVWCDGRGLFDGAQPNRAVLATPYMEREGFVRQTDYKQVANTGELYTVLNGPLVVLGNDGLSGAAISLTESEMADMKTYFSEISKPYSGLTAAMAVREHLPFATYPEIFEEKGFVGAGHGADEPDSDLSTEVCDLFASVFDDFDPADLAMVDVDGVRRGGAGAEL